MIEFNMNFRRIVNVMTVDERGSCDEYTKIIKFMENNKVNQSDISLQQLEDYLPEVKLGGQYSPELCVPKERVAIIFPVRNREQHLRIMLRNLHPFLIRQQRDYRIFVIEQSEKGAFNRGKLLNIGYTIALNNKYTCFFFHDVDLIPENNNNIYKCESNPVHFSAANQKYHYKLVTHVDECSVIKLPYANYFGGIAAMTSDQFTKANGFSNLYQGWGAEDDDIYARITNSGMNVTRKSLKIARYTALAHKSNRYHKNYKNNLNLWKKAFKTYKSNATYKLDGLNTLKYETVRYEEFKLYTNIIVNI
ncbi:hypothetical protein B4U80_10589 [Leptotrombidium deliense]|uniref:Beta-1,4-N-acetylgalactosaminyltransferase n=1 Tax=Leptotrombidium deliense TaxID=299467 RepID=A0A443SJA4_9ACAR|nr:hypothetical protein B4U80_10589 [Leptotrombidium deliense]